MMTNFKHQLPTRTEYRDQRKAEKLSEQQACYRAVDLRDGSVCRVTGAYLTAGATNPHHRREHHHMLPRSRGGSHEMANLITIAASVHEQIHAGKIHLSGDANLRDSQGRLCGVTLERMTEGGWRKERML